MSPATAPVVLLLFLVSAAIPPVPMYLRILAGVELLGLWFYWLWRERRGFHREVVRKNLLGLLPGHALLFLGLGLARAGWGLYLWLPLPFLAVSFDLAAHRAPRSIVAFLYAILWFVIFALVHRWIVVAKGLTGTGFLVWSAIMICAASAYVGLGLVRIMSGKR